MSKRIYNYDFENKVSEFGGLLQYKFDAVDIVARDENGKILTIDFYQNGLTLPQSKKVMTIVMTYDENGYRKTIDCIDLLTVAETNLR